MATGMRRSISWIVEEEDTCRESFHESHSDDGDARGAGMVETGESPHRERLAWFVKGSAGTAASAVLAVDDDIPFLLRCSVCIERKDDTPEDIRLKRLLTPPIAVVTFLLGVALVRDTVGQADSGTYYDFARAIPMSTGLLFFAAGLAGFSMGWVLDVTLILFAVCNIAVDLHQQAVLELSLISLVVVILDMAILCARDHIGPIVIALTLCYFLVERVESSFRLGLYELAGEKVAACDCAAPPCAQSFFESSTLMSFLMASVVLDYFLTHRFAADLRTQLSRLESVASVSEEVTAALARYDVAAATRALNTTSARDIPARMRQALETMLENMHQFKAAMPIDVLTKKNRAVINTEEMTEEEPQFNRLFEL
eukprot:Hpha_TRINITY_DN16308_c2_g9::TRINITY_DN16308_c2_g9_i1::g.58766::m.58766